MGSNSLEAIPIHTILVAVENVYLLKKYSDRFGFFGTVVGIDGDYLKKMVQEKKLPISYQFSPKLNFSKFIFKKKL